MSPENSFFFKKKGIHDLGKNIKIISTVSQNQVQAFFWKLLKFNDLMTMVRETRENLVIYNNNIINNHSFVVWFSLFME